MVKLWYNHSNIELAVPSSSLNTCIGDARDRCPIKEQEHDGNFILKALYGLLICLGLCLPQLAWADSATASLDRSITSSQESVQLTIHVDGSADDDPDLSVLSKDFEMLSQSQNSSYSLINGSLKRSKDWQITLMPKHIGMLHIPSISLGNMVTHALTLKVLDASRQVPQNQNQDVFLKLSASSVDVYVQAQVLLTVQLFRAINLSQAQLSEPESPHAMIKRLGKDKNYETVLNQRRYVVTERQYAVFPQQSGSLHIPAVVMSGQISNGMGIFNQGGRVMRIRSKDLDIQVHPMPVTWDANQAWLPASAVTLREIPNAHDADTLHVGDSLTRTIEIRVHGLSAEQLPPLLPKNVSQNMAQTWKQYTDKPELKTEADAHGVVGIRREKIALVPTQSGDLSLPAIDVTWWNTQTQRVEHATVLKRIVSVADNPALTSNQIVTPSKNGIAASIPPTGSSPQVIKTSKSEGLEDTNQALSSSDSGVSIWQGISAALGMGWLLTLLWLGYGKQRQRQKDEQVLREQQRNLKSVRKALKQACQSGDIGRVKAAVLVWAEVIYGEQGLSFARLKGKSSALDEALDDLQRHLYSDHQEHWDAMKLWQAVEHLDVQERPQKDAPLQALSDI